MSGTPADETAIRGMGAKYAEAWNKGDLATMSSMVTENYDGVAPDGTVIKGRAAAAEMDKKELAGRAGMNLKLDVHWAGANAASAGGTWTVAGIPAGVGGDKGSWTIVAVKDADGQWRMASGLVAQFVPPPAPPTPSPTPAPKGKGK
jgi:ketosteroid isomerase-like protein